MKKPIRLTERDLTRIVKKIIKESEMEDSEEFDFEEVDDFGEMEDNNNELSQEEVIPLIAQFFKQEVLSENRNRRRLRENKRGSKFAEKALMGGWIGSTLGGLTGLIGSAAGWTDTQFQTKIHEFINSLGMGEYSGPISTAMIVAGLAMALGGYVKKYNRQERERS